MSQFNRSYENADRKMPTLDDAGVPNPVGLIPECIVIPT